MCPLTDRLDGRLGRANQLADLAVGQFGVEFHQPQDRRRTVLPLGQRRITRTAALFLTHSGRIVFQCQFVHGIFLGRLDFLGRQLVVGDRIKALHTGRHIAIRNALHFQLMQFTKIGDLLEADGGVINQPNGGCFCHDRFGHFHVSFDKSFPCRENGWSGWTLSSFSGKLAPI